MKIPKTISLTLLLILLGFACEKLEREMLLKTLEVTELTSSSLLVSGEIVDVGENMSDHGAYYSSSPGAQNGIKISLGRSGVKGLFSVPIAGLKAQTRYYIRVYGASGDTYSFGEEISVVTENGTPILGTTIATEVSASSAKSGGLISSDEGFEVTARGVCWNTSPNPTTNHSKTVDGSGSGSFVSSIPGLNSNTRYYYRAYATNSIGTAYGQEESFTTSSGSPTVSTRSITSITQNTATGGGEVLDDAGFAVTTRGICWGLEPNPDISGNHTSNGAGKGIFTGEMSGLGAGTSYYVRAYATNAKGTGYGELISFQTEPGPPNVSTAAISSIEGTSAISGGSIISDGGSPITAKGICWSTGMAPTTADSKTSNGSGSGDYSSQMTDLSPGETYYVRAYASNSAGTSYGELRNFRTKSAPEVSTSAVNNITQSSAIGGGTVVNDGGSTISTRGLCWSTNPGPDINGAHSIETGEGGSFTSVMTHMLPNTTYYVRAYANNEAGTGYGADITFTTDDAMNLTIGQNYQGGIVAYILKSGDPGYDPEIQHGLIAAPYDQSSGISWSNAEGSLQKTGSESWAIGSGRSNTNSIVATYGEGSYAAKICFDLELNGYNDWYLPSKNELARLYYNRATIGGFSSYAYWSSSEQISSFGDSWQAYEHYFGSGTVDAGDKDWPNKVRAIRSF